MPPLTYSKGGPKITGKTASGLEFDAVILVDETGSPTMGLGGSQGLTDNQLRAAPLQTAPNVSRGAGNGDANTQRVTLAADSPGASGIGAQADAAADPSGGGNYSIIAALKRGLLNWSVLLGRIPAQAIPGMLTVDTLAALGVARQLAAGANSTDTALTPTTRRISIHARLADIRYAIGQGAQTASATTHYIAAGERLDFDVPVSAHIAVIKAGPTDAVLEVSELTAS